MSNFPHLRSYGKWTRMPPDFLADLIKRARAENAPADTWCLCSRTGWRTISDLERLAEEDDVAADTLARLRQKH
jgi:hypothetical protein